VLPTCVTVVLLSTAMGFSRLSVTVAVAVADAALTAETVTEVVVGMAAGAVYKPLDEIVPVALDPPATPFTSQTTAALELPLTTAVNCVVPLRRTEDAPLTATITEGELPEPVDPPEQPARNAKAKSAAADGVFGDARSKRKCSIEQPPHFAKRHKTIPVCRKGR
jgi:hypothetical protein